VSKSNSYEIMRGYDVDSIENSFDDSNNSKRDDQELFSYNDLSRRDMRSLIFNLLYMAEVFDYQESLEAIVDNFNRGFNLDIPCDSKVFTVAQAIIKDHSLLDKIYQPLLTNWRLERVSMCTKLILRFGIWELINTSLDQRIIINEAIELTKCFAEEGAYRFVNGILDRVAQERLPKKISNL